MIKKVGIYDFGCRQVELKIDTNDSGGSFDCGSSPHLSEMIIGIRDNKWNFVVGILQHEAFEMEATVSGYRYAPNPCYAQDSGAWMFVLDHKQMAETMSRIGYFISDCLPELSKRYRELRRVK